MKGFGRNAIRGLSPVLLAAALTGCGQQVQTTKLYLMDYVPAPGAVADSTAARPLPLRVQIREFKIPRTFDRTRIVYRYSPNELNYYRYYQWAVPPRVMITDLVEKHIVASGLFDAVAREFYDERPDYEVAGNIVALEKYESGQFGGAHLAMSLEFVRPSDNVTLVAHEFDREVELMNPAMTFFAQKMSEILEGEVQTFLVAVDEYFRALEPGVGEAPPETTLVSPQ